VTGSPVFETAMQNWKGGAVVMSIKMKRSLALS